MSTTSFTPAEVFPPGDFIREELEARGWSQVDLAEILGRPPRLISELIAGKRSVTPETAKGLSLAFGTSPELWMNLESSYQLSKVKPDGRSVARRAKLYEKVPVKDLIRRGWIQHSANVEVLEHQICSFLGIRTIDEEPSVLASARKSDANDGWSGGQLAWLMRVKQLAQKIPAPSYSKAKLSVALTALGRLHRTVDEVDGVPEVLSNSGVRCVIVEHLPGTKIDGACLWLEGNHPVIGLSFRYDRIDWFWFTLMHELGHLLHEDGRAVGATLDVELVGSVAHTSAGKPKAERLADLFAMDALISQRTLDAFIAKTGNQYSKSAIVQGAEKCGVHPGILVGQLQHRGCVPYSHFRSHLVKVRERLARTTVTDGWDVVRTNE
ncbi:MAG: HigA family addiction module antidote protein [Planctomycetes bacterium]|nr:HigA family addiction module antidote protein [Planctomycetota bacterium]